MRRVVKMIGNQGNGFALSVLCFLATACGSISRQPGALAAAREDQGRNLEGVVVCSKVNTGVELVRFATSQGQASYSDSEFTMEVKVIGVDLSSILLKNAETGDVVEANRQEGLLSAQLTTDEYPSHPVVASTTDHIRGTYQLAVATSSGDKFNVVAVSHRGAQSITLTLQTDENPAEPLEVFCTRK